MKQATRIVFSTFGGLTGLMGVEHGIGEILQGLVRHEGLMIQSWPNSPFFKILGGEPAMTIISNLLVTGVFACIFSLLYSGWAVFGTNRKHCGWILFALSIAMLLFGGGIFPPVFGVIIAVVIASRKRLVDWGQRVFSKKSQKIMANAWPWMFGAALFSWLAMIPGVPVLNTVYGLDNSTLIFVILACMFGFIFLSILCGVGKDVREAAGFSRQV